MSDKTAGLYVRMKPETKEKAEDIFKRLGLSPSTAINMFYEQVILQKGLPFAIKLPPKRLVPDANTEKEFAEFLHERYQKIDQDGGKEFNQFLADHKGKYKVDLDGNKK